jgi:hypothetical protein
MYLNECKAQANGRFGFEHEYAAGAGSTNALTIRNFSADWNNLGALGFKGMNPNETVFINGVKSEGTATGIEADAYLRGAPGYQSNCIVFDNCDRTVALVNGVSHIRIERAVIGPGPAITIKDSTGAGKKPRLTFNGVMTRIGGWETGGTTGDAVTLRDQISSVDITNTVTSGTYPGGPTFPTLLDNSGNKLLQFVGYAGTATAFFNVYNAPNFPTIAAADSTQANVNIALQPKGTGTIYLDSATPSITAGASSGVDRSLDLRSRGTGTVQINAVDAADVSSAQTLSSKTLTSPKINSILDTNGNTIMSMVPVASAVNYIATVNNAAGSAPSFQAGGSDSNIGLTLYSKGLGSITLRGAASGTVVLVATPVASGVNALLMQNAVTGASPSIAATGTDTNVGLNLISKGSGVVQANSVEVADISSAQTLTTKTISGASNTLSNIANGSLTNSAITIAGTSTALGASITQDTITGLSTNGLVKRTGANTLAAATADTDYLAPGGALGTPSSGTLTNVTGLPLAGLVSAAYATAATASTLAQRDSNSFLTASGFIPTKSVTSTSGTTTLTVASSQVQEFTHSSGTVTLNLPTTGVVAGQAWTLMNNGSGTVAIYPSSGGGGITTLTTNIRVGMLTARIDTPTANTDWIYSAIASLSAASTLAQRDVYANITSNNFIPTATSVATAAATTTLTIASAQTQNFTGVTTQTVKLPTTSVVAGQTYNIINNSTGVVSVQSSGGNAIATVASLSGTIFLALASAPTTAAHWRAI